MMLFLLLQKSLVEYHKAVCLDLLFLIFINNIQNCALPLGDEEAMSLFADDTKVYSTNSRTTSRLLLPQSVTSFYIINLN